MLNTHTLRGLGGLHDTHDAYDTRQPFGKSAIASPLLIQKINVEYSYASWAGGTLDTLVIQFFFTLSMLSPRVMTFPHTRLAAL